MTLNYLLKIKLMISNLKNSEYSTLAFAKPGGQFSEILYGWGLQSVKITSLMPKFTLNRL